MSKIAELTYDIEQLYIEGYSAIAIAVQLGCPVEMVNDWITSEGLELDQEITQRGEAVFASMVKDLA